MRPCRSNDRDQEHCNDDEDDESRIDLILHFQLQGRRTHVGISRNLYGWYSFDSFTNMHRSRINPSIKGRIRQTSFWFSLMMSKQFARGAIMRHERDQITPQMAKSRKKDLSPISYTCMKHFTSLFMTRNQVDSIIMTHFLGWPDFSLDLDHCCSIRAKRQVSVT